MPISRHGDRQSEPRPNIDHRAERAAQAEQAGAVLTTTETCLFEWVGGAGHPQFKAISKLIQERMKQR